MHDPYDNYEPALLMNEDPNAVPVMRITATRGEVYFMEGADSEEARAAFGADCEIEFGLWTSVGVA